MSKVVRQNDLNRFYGKLYNIRNIAETATELIADNGEKIAKSEYAGINSVQVIKDIDGNSAVISANGDSVAYIEYGTGLVGQGTYKGDLPTQTLTFESPKRKAGDTRPPRVNTTHGWEYYYDNPETKVLGGWFFGRGYSNFTRGQVAGNQMFNAAKSLREYIKTDLAKDIRNKQ